MNDMRTDLNYLLRQLQSATEPQEAAPTPPVATPVTPETASPMTPAEFLEAVVRVRRARADSDALLQKAKADLQAINATLPQLWAELDADPETTVIRAAE